MIRLVVSLTTALLLSGCFTSAQTAMPKAVVTTEADITSPSGLKYSNTNVVSREAQPALAKSGDNVGVHYTGWLTDGTQFDSSRAASKPIVFRLGTGAVIKGWDEGIAGMAVGDKRKLVIPALGYGAAGSPPVIPSNAVLIFEVELMSIGK